MAAVNVFLVALLFAYVIAVQQECEAGKKKKPCKYNNQKYNAGDVIEALEDNCVELKCSMKGEKTELKLMKDCVCGKEVTEPSTDGPNPTDGPKPTDGGSDCDYSVFGGDHTMVKYPGSSNTCGTILKKGVTDQEKDNILQKHNELRAKVANGLVENQPQAANMLEMRWNTQLVEVAQRWAEQCQFRHDIKRQTCSSDYSYVGQNAYKANRSGPHRNNSLEISAVEDWFDEVISPGFDAANINPFVVDYGAGHYTQVVWAKTYEVGCGTIQYTTDEVLYSTIYVCNYGPGGNMQGSPMYEIDTAASNCPYGVSFDYTGLCAPPS